MNFAFPIRRWNRKLFKLHHQANPEQHWRSNENNSAANADMSATSEWLNYIDWATHNGPSALRSASSAKPFAAGYAPVSFPSGSRGLAVAATSASSMSICSNAGIRVAITRLAYFRRSGHADTVAAVRWFLIMFRPGGLIRRHIPHRRSEDSTASRPSMRPS